MSETITRTVGDLTQDGRLISIETPLGKDRLLLAALDGEETISEPFAYEVEMLSTDQAISAESLIGRNAKLVITSEDGKTRPIHGMFAELRAGPLVGRGLRQYHAKIVPWLWYLGHTTDCRIYPPNLSVPEVLEQVFGNYGCTDYKMAVAAGDYAKREFCVQYRESALNFVSRLMEEEGIFYFFQHEPDRHLMVIADSNSRFPALPETKLIYAPGNLRSGHITTWEHSYQFRPGRWAQKDFNFESPSTDLTTSEKTVLKLRNAQAFERYDYPGRYTVKGVGTQLTRKLMEAEEAAHHAVHGGGNYPGLDAGGKFRLQSHPLEDESKQYVVRRVRHMASNSDYLSTSGGVARYENSFEAIPHNVPFRPMRVTEKPFVHGPQTAIVVGPPGEKIFTDKHGRVRVQFHWDRYGKRDDKSSCWIRVSQSWAGRGWGGVNLPHVGHEVLVSFLEGDPDNPMVTGRVYNGENAQSIGMPDNKTQSGLKDHSGNEILMEGKSGSEDIRVHAVKDMHVVVDNDREMHVKAHLKETVDNGQDVTIAKGYKETITEGATTEVTGGLKSTVNGPWESKVNGKFTETVTGPIKQSSSATTDLHATGAGTYTSEASLKFAVSGSVIEITPTAITISSGPSTVKLDASGVAVSGPKISLNG